MARLASLLRTRPHYRRLWFGEVVSALGDWLSYVALSVLVLQQGEGALALALVYVGHILPTGLVAPIAGWAADRLERRRMLVVIHALQGPLLVAMAATACCGWLGWTQVLLFVRTSLAGLVYPVRQAALKDLVAPEELLAANTLDAATWSVGFAFGTALGGLLAMVDPILALLVDGATALVAAAIFAGLPQLPASHPALHHPSDERDRRSVSAGVGQALRQFTQDLRHGWHLVEHNAALREAALSKAPIAMAAGGAWLVMTLDAEQSIPMVSVAAALGIMQAVRGIGTGVGPLLADRYVQRGSSAQTLLRLVTWGTLAVMAVFVWLPYPLLPLPVMLLWGMGSGANWVLSSSETLRLAPPAASGRMAALEMLSQGVGQSTVAIVAALLIEHAGNTAGGGLAIGVGVASYLLILRSGDAHEPSKSAMLG